MVLAKLSHALVVILCAFSTVLNAYDLSKGPRAKQEELGPLGVTLDYGLASNWPAEVVGRGTSVARNWVCSSHIKFKGTVINRLSDGQLWKIAQDAYNELDADAAFYGIASKKQKPNAMSALAYPNELILVSSQKGKTSFACGYAQSKVLKSLRLCQIVWNDIKATDDPHHSEGSCGEVMATHLYYTQNDWPLEERNARIATIVNNVRKPPCGTDTDDFWGCNLFVKAEGLTYLDTSIADEDYVLKDVTGIDPEITQIPLCSA